MLDQIHARLEASLGEESLRRLHGSLVAVFGVGLLGGPLTTHLAMLQVRQILVDCGVVEPPNLGNQAFPVAALGEPKAAAREAQAAALNPSCPVRSLHARVEELGLGAFAGADLLLTALDGRAARVAARNVSQRLAIPMIDAALDGSGERLLGTVSCYDPREEASACYACRYDAAALAAIAREGRGPGCPSWRGGEERLLPSTLTASPFGAIVAGFQLLWALRVLDGDGAALAGRQLQIQLRRDGEPRLRVVELPRSPHCLFSHRPLRPLARVAAATVGALVERARNDLGAEIEALELHDRIAALGLLCPSCGERSAEARLSHACSDDQLRCPCGSEKPREPARLADRLDAREAKRLAGLRWSDFGLPHGDVVTAVSARGERHYLVAWEDPS